MRGNERNDECSWINVALEQHKTGRSMAEMRAEQYLKVAERWKETWKVGVVSETSVVMLAKGARQQIDRKTKTESKLPRGSRR